MHQAQIPVFNLSINNDEENIVLEPSTGREVICVIDDEPELNQVLCEFLREQGYEVLAFPSGQGFLSWADVSRQPVSLIISDIGMPGVSGIELCRKLRAKKGAKRIPIILVTGGLPAASEKAVGLEAGADDFITKPFNRRELLAKVRSLLEIQANEARTLGKLARFLPSKLGDLLTTESKQSLLKPHRLEVTVMFVDLRRFTAFSARVEPEEVLEVLGKYYTAVGNAALRYSGTLGHLAGDGIMVFFNDPEPVDRHQEAAVKMALEVRSELEVQKKLWRQRAYDIDFGIGLAQGFATIGGIGFEQFWQYSVIGPVTNFAARLCQVADHGQILVSQRFLGRLGEGLCETETVGEVQLKGIAKKVVVYNVLSMPANAARPKTDVPEDGAAAA